MTGTPASPEESQPAPKRSLSDLLPTKAAVATSLGTLYIRHVYTSDWKHLESDDAENLGKAAVRQLCSRNEDKRNSEPLATDEVDALNEADLQVLVPVIAKRSGWGHLSANAGFKELGDAVKAAKAQLRERHQKMLADMHKSIDVGYSFLPKSSLESLKAQMEALSDIRSTMPGTDAVQAAMKGLSPLVDVLNVAKGSGRTTKNEIEGTRERVRAEEVISRQSRIHPEVFIPPRPEETPLGRAAIESAENSRDVARKMEDLVDLIAGIHQTMVQDVVPAWFKKVKEDQEAAEGAVRQAADSLWWTKWAVIFSVVVALLTTAWQVSVAREIDRENTELQKRIEATLNSQLLGQQKLIEQQAREAVALREAINASKSSAVVVVPKSLGVGSKGGSQ